MPCDKKSLFDFLEAINQSLTRKITLVAAGGTAMTLLDLKPSTIDIDFTMPHNDLQEFEQALKNNPTGYKVDRWTDGCVFCQTLPSDYLGKSIKIREYSHITLRALNPVDVIATKIGRLNERDIQDIEAIIRKHRVSKMRIKKRALQVSPTYVSKEEDYLYNLKWVLENLFKKNPASNPSPTAK
jgi:ABC-type phosphate transport system auxiliary subunit